MDGSRSPRKRMTSPAKYRDIARTNDFGDGFPQCLALLSRKQVTELLRSPAEFAGNLIQCIGSLRK